MNHEPLAVIGLALRFPGASDPRAFWELLERHGDAIREVPADRWDVDAFYDPAPGTPGKMCTRFGGFLEGVDAFDPQFFGISAREAETMDPQERLILEVAYEALEDAGLRFSALAGTPTGVFMGFQVGDYYNMITASGAELDAYVATGNSPAIISNRISYLLDLRGPSLSIDTACSSGLVALHLAAKSLRSGESSLALAGAVNLLLSPEKTIALSQAGMMAPDGRCKAFDHRADGYVRSEGAGVVVLKRLADARRDGDPIWAVLRGTATNQDGRSNGLTAPNGLAQEAVIHAALADAEVAPGEISFVEAHGTGTPLGDPIELAALASVLGQGRRGRLRVGSVKTNIGHLESAAGMAGLIKVILALSEGMIPANLHLEKPNPALGLERLPIELPAITLPWPRTATPRRAGVSSFGFGGTNAHAVLEESPAPRARRGRGRDRGAHVVALSGRTPELVRDEATALAELIDRAPWLDLGDLAHTRNLGRDGGLHRAAVVARDLEGLGARLSGLASGEASADVLLGQRRRKAPKIAFLFTGQGSQVHGMGRALFEAEPSFRADLERCAAIADAELEKPLLELLYSQEGPSGVKDSSRSAPLREASDPALDRTSNAQVALFALEYALAEWWRRLGVRPDVVLGHSLGEIVAAVVAKSLSLEDAIRLVVVRGKLMAECGGKMAAVFAPLDVVADAVEPSSEAVNIAAINEPEHVVISGSASGVAEVTARLEALGRTVRPLRVSGAFHSPEMEPVLERFRAAIAPIGYSKPELPWVSNLTGQLQDRAPDASYWVRHVRRPVQFLSGLRTAAELGATVFLELGPSAVLKQLGRRSLSEETLTWLASLDPKDEWGALARSAAALWAAGVEVDWARFDAAHDREKVRIPPLPYDRRRVWFTPGVREGRATGLFARFERQAEAAPERVAIRSAAGAVTYRELAERTRRAPTQDVRLEGRAPSPELVVDLLAALGRPRSSDGLGERLRAVEGLAPRLLRGLGSADGVRTWLAPASAAQAEGVLELLAPILLGDTLVFSGPPRPVKTGERPLALSLLYFAAEDGAEGCYRMMLDGARFADERGFSAVWVQEQHFHPVGGPYPSPALAAAAIAAVTKRIGVRGHVRLPLHHPVRVAEEWGMVDRLSAGRVGLAFSSSLDPGDYVFGQSAFEERNQVLAKNLPLVRGLWRGQSLSVRIDGGQPFDLMSYPRPTQRELPVWLSAGCEDPRYLEAAKLGARIIVPLAAMRFDDLVRRIGLYRDAWRETNAGEGHVTVMLHAFLGDDVEVVKETVREPMTRQLRLNAERLAAVSADPDIKGVSPAQLEEFARRAFDQHFERGGLFGTVETARPKVELFRQIGVDELAFLVDFGLAEADYRASLERLAELAASASSSGDLFEGLTRVHVFGDPPPELAAGHPELAFVSTPRPEVSAEPPAEVARPVRRAPREPDAYAAPTTDTERLLADLWGQALRVPKVGIHDDFFSLGGDSRLAIEIVARAKAAGLVLDVLQFLERPTIAAIAAGLGEASGP